MRAALILASESPRRRDLLAQVGIEPAEIIPSNVEEIVRPGELPREHAGRLAREKAEKVSSLHPGALVLAADTVVACGRRILPKADNADIAHRCLALISGRAHQVFTGLALAGPMKESRLRVVRTRVKIRHLDLADIESYLRTGEWRGKAGGYAIQGSFAAHVIEIIGSYSNVVGLPLYETVNLLKGAGWRRA